jgi:erythromycin esterase
MSQNSSRHNSSIENIQEDISHISYDLHTSNDLDPLLDHIGDARIVMLGEASHGTHEYYIWRAQISKRLIKEKGFNFIGVEGDWPDCYQINRFIKGYKDSGKDILDVLKNFNRWPTWMWGNWEIASFANILKELNDTLPKEEKIGFYGLDVYSLFDSLEAILEYLKKEDPSALETAKKAFDCFQPYAYDEGISYARASMGLVPVSCENAVVNMLKEIRRKAQNYDHDLEASLSAEQNAVIAVNAEKYYRAMLRSGSESWNIRDKHMMETLNRLLEYHGPESKAIVWEHNTHIGDARATSMANRGMVNIGSLVREQYDEKDVVLVGFGSYKGNVIAGEEWGAPMQKMIVPEAKAGSWEEILHKMDAKNRLIILDNSENEDIKSSRIGHRAIGVVYEPDYDYAGNYVPSKIGGRYNAFMYIDETNALHPLNIQPDGHKIPDTYPFDF